MPAPMQEGAMSFQMPQMQMFPPYMAGDLSGVFAEPLGGAPAETVGGGSELVELQGRGFKAYSSHVQDICISSGSTPPNQESVNIPDGIS